MCGVLHSSETQCQCGHNEWPLAIRHLQDPRKNTSDVEDRMKVTTSSLARATPDFRNDNERTHRGAEKLEVMRHETYISTSADVGPRLY